MLAAAGTSLVVSATLPHAYAALPLGPVLLEWRREGRDALLPGDPAAEPAGRQTVSTAGAERGRTRWQFDWHVHAVSAFVLAAALLRGDQPDFGASAWAGTPVVRRGAARMAERGLTYSGLIILRRAEEADVGPRARRRTLAHEAIHAVQWTQLELPAALPAERAAVRSLPLPGAVRTVTRHVDLGVASALAVAAWHAAVPYECRPEEREAYRLTLDPTWGRTPRNSAARDAGVPADPTGPRVPVAFRSEARK